MARRIVAVIAAASVLSGCAHVHGVDPVASGHELDDLNRALQDRRVSVELVSSVAHRPASTLQAEGVRVAADSTSMTLLLEPSDVTALWGLPSYGVKRDTTLSTSAIRTLSIKRPGPGAVRGLWGGFLVGASVGVAVGAVSYKGPDIVVGSRAASAGLGGVLLGLVGAGAGLIGGTIVGGTVVYDFTVTPPDSSVTWAHR